VRRQPGRCERPGGVATASRDLPSALGEPPLFVWPFCRGLPRRRLSAVSRLPSGKRYHRRADVGEAVSGRALGLLAWHSQPVTRGRNVQTPHPWQL
jgi:hypothetical protein